MYDKTTINDWFKTHPEKTKFLLSKRKINTFDGSFSIYGRMLKLEINGIECDISEIIPYEVWNIGGEFKDPIQNWEVRNELSKITRQFIKMIDPYFPSGNIIF